MDGDNLKLKYIMKKSIRIQMRQCRVVELYDGNNSATGATKFYLSIDFDI